ncbi:MAG: methylated-DNA--[protein]-cysteine S-methyltransferase [Gemmataceae bacterium]|nr:methylated-DNA--[protein]-cysteine S-methyltransferase [Gemmataceae bacterium]MDW8264180.1 methylated-DNA--[protein]-cysteine S-methyltransferase [Gemmataceae bacterium]
MNRPTIRQGRGRLVVGHAVVAWGDRGVVALEFRGPDGEADFLHRLGQRWPGTNLVRDDTTAAAILRRVARILAGKPADGLATVLTDGTPFQRQVWRVLQGIPRGRVISYRDLARRVGRPAAVRAVAQACAVNPIAILIPCHRVIRSDGTLGGYRGGMEIKRQLLALEGALPAPPP